MKYSLLSLFLLMVALTIQSADAQQAAGTFHNPLLAAGPDPWVTSANGFYYYMNTTGRDLTIRRTPDTTDLEHATVKTVWTPPASGPYSKHKYDHPFYKQDREPHVFGPGHNGFFQFPDGKEEGIIYHANPEPGQGCGDHRSPRIQKFQCAAGGTPDFGWPESTDTELVKPSGSFSPTSIN